MTYIAEVRHLLEACDCRSDIYKRKSIRAAADPHPLTLKERRQVERLSTERGYRRFTADHMGRA
jgi:hypothetical protein